ncbi:MAG: CAP domain-containing protein [Patescibacteria group bacterium]
MKHFKIIILVLLIILLFGGGFLFFWNQILNLYNKLYLELPQFEKGVGDFLMQEIEKQISTPPPLRAPVDAPEAFLTKAGVIKWTNTQRAKYGLPILKENLKLDASAQLKVEDMFKNQYFGHTSPSGVEVGDLANEVAYEFISIGENLALGNFENDERLVEAWMNSPGHRENILNTKYKEIGVAVFEGTFEGKTTWLAVQHFALPLSVCPKPDDEVKTEIETDRDRIKEIEIKLEQLLTEIQDMRKRDPEYNRKVEEYNALVSQYNNLVGEIKVLIDSYNSQVKLFNECVISSQ